MSPELVAQLNEILVELEAEVTDKKARKALEKFNKRLADYGDKQGVVIQRVNWNS